MTNETLSTSPAKPSPNVNRSWLTRNPVFRLYKTYVIDSIIIIKNEGFKSLLKQRGLKFFMVIFFYYLIRDSILYLLIPALIAYNVMK